MSAAFPDRLRTHVHLDGRWQELPVYEEIQVVIRHLLRDLLAGVDTPQNRRLALRQAGASQTLIDWICATSNSEAISVGPSSQPPTQVVPPDHEPVPIPGTEGLTMTMCKECGEKIRPFKVTDSMEVVWRHHIAGPGEIRESM